jgi:hypothetical protein
VWLTLVDISIEVNCPRHGLERFNVKVIKRFNISSDKIVPKLRSRPKKGELTRLYVGRSVSYNEVENYLIGYFREKGILDEIVRMKMLL